MKYYIYFIYYRLCIGWNIFRAKNSLEKHTFQVMKYVLLKHHQVGQKYDDQYPYFYHLKMVYGFALKFGHLLNAEDAYKCFLGALLHDVIEDCRLTYNDVKAMFGKEIADIVYACTELRGKTRGERHGDEYIQGLQDSRLGTYVKLCDICANMTMGKMTGSSMLEKYKLEYPKTRNMLYREEFDKIFEYLVNEFKL